MKVTVSGAIAIPKASWGCAPALPNRIQLVFLRAMFHVKHSELLLGKPIATGSAESLRCLPLCCSPMVVLSELRMNTS